MASQSSQLSQGGARLSAQDLNSLITDTVLYLLSQDHLKYPVKRQDISKNCLKNYPKHFKQVMQEAKCMLKQIFGMELVEYEVNSGMKHYMLMNDAKYKPDVSDMMLSVEEESHLCLLMIVLAFIFMSGGVVKEDSLWSVLTDLGILQNNRKHEYFGDVRKLLTMKFVRQAYLEYIRLPDTDPPQHEFRWGRRADSEVSRRALLDFVCLVYNNCKPQNWTMQYQEMLKTEMKKKPEANS